MASPSTFQIDESTKLRLVLYKNVKNSTDLIKKLKTGYFKCSFINPTLIVDGLQVAIAAYKAALFQKTNKLITNTVYTEVIFNLSSRKSITRALITFGLQTDSTSLLVSFINDENNEEYEKVHENVEADEVDLADLKNLTDIQAVIKEYDISPEELEIGSILDAVLGRMATKDCL